MKNNIKFLVITRLVLHVNSFYIEPELPLIPDKCHAIPELMYRQCCIFPPFFIREVARDCGAAFRLNFVDEDAKVAGLLRRSFTGCAYWKCILEKYLLLDSDGNVDDEKYYLHLDKWLDLNPMFTKVIVNAKIRCRETHRRNFPLHPCEFSTFQSCIRNFVTVNCPSVLPTPRCSEQKSFYEECKEYYE